MKPDFSKYPDGLIPAIIQDQLTAVVLMLGYMNEEAFEKTLLDKQVTFFSRSRKRLWTKGEESGHFLDVCEVMLDCDRDTILIKATPRGHVCHTGTDTCFNEKNSPDFLKTLENIILDRKLKPSGRSYTSRLFLQGIRRISQKVGEEAVELIIESMEDNQDLFINEAADLLFHYLVLLREKGVSFSDVIAVLETRNTKS
ncbi:MAG: bifunctional phosphoribosyl-AMP cyclohydrolase/phosphoribosyl-ATP diphosphatase HisIE [Bacteroidales bacterium]|jgi:phosphoribosyl-ATP pyrophosphohydrolase/phosphoribosyl-AMP cyclohydrolase|nr:bifunctional phosphoribosyl-AMP cyclohydrolase/phosphoribosyl-ATP diphosphatase HisIE [Bacteroidales bacterium]